MAKKKAKKAKRSSAKYRCYVCKRDVTSAVEALLRANNTVTARVRGVSSIALETAQGPQRLNIASGQRTVIVTCSKGHENVFDV
jgi:hypothetical protein